MALAWREIPTPDPGPGEVLVRIRAVLTCGTDLKTYRRGHPKLGFGPFGHEASGLVEKAGEGVTAFVPSDPVMWVHTAPCGECPACGEGQENLCERLFDEVALGAYGDRLLLPAKLVERNLFHKPEHLSFIEAAFLEPLSCIVHGWNAVRRADARRPLPREVAIIGAGTVGLLHALYAKHAGLRVTVAGRPPQRLALARELGADETLDASDVLGTALPVVRRFPLVIEAAGSEETWRCALDLTAPGGRTLLFGGLPSGTQVPLDATRLHYGEVTCLGVFHFTPADVREAWDLLASGALALRPLVSGVEPLDALFDVFRRLDRREGYKYALVPDAGRPEWV